MMLLGLMLLLVLLAGLIFVAAIKTDIDDRLTGLIFPAHVKVSSFASMAVSHRQWTELHKAPGRRGLLS